MGLSLKHAGMVLLSLATLGCAALSDPVESQYLADAVSSRDAADRAWAAFGKSDFVNAERLSMIALRYNPKDPVALLVAGLSYHAMGRDDLARQYFEVIITNQTPGTVMVANDAGSLVPRPIMDLARLNMNAIDKAQGRYTSRSAQESGRSPGVSAVGAPPLPIIEPVGPSGGTRPHVGAQGLEMVGGYQPGRITDAEANVAGRFKILKRLLEDGLITPEEFSRRRTANLGGLMPFSQPLPSAGLDRPIPQEQSVVQRLRDLGTTLESRGISPTEHAAERLAILDALLPTQPRKTELNPLPPKDMLEAAGIVGRIERFRAAGLITDAEARKEKEAVERTLDSQLAAHRVNGAVTGLKPVTPPPANGKTQAAKENASWGVVLAQAATEEAAQSAWSTIKAKFPEDLAGKEAQIKKGGKAGAYRVVVGPLGSKDAARKMCKTMKLYRQSCDPVAM